MPFVGKQHKYLFVQRSPLDVQTECSKDSGRCEPMATLQVAAGLLALYIAYNLVTSTLRKRRFAAFAKANGCLPAYDATGPWPYGWNRLRRMTQCRTSGEDILDDIIAELFTSANTVQTRVFDGQTLIQTIEPANIQALLATQFKDFETGKRRYNQFKPVLGRSIFSSDGPFWEHSRALFRPQFARDNINDLEATERAAQMLLSAIEPSDAAGWTKGEDLLPLLLNFTLDTATDFLFGESLESQAAAIKRKTLPSADAGTTSSAAELASSLQFSEDFRAMGIGAISRIRLQSLYWLADGFAFRRAIANVRRLVEHYVQRAVQEAKSEKETTKKYNLLSELATQTQDREELRNQTLALLVAGRDSTAALLGWTFSELALHPDVYAKLRRIILDDFPSGEPVSFAKLKSCRYLQHVLNEALRLHNIVPMNMRVAARDTTIPVGGGADQRSPIAVKKGQVVIYSVYLMHLRKDLWGADAREFQPERWESKVPAWQFLPFNGGPRICIGRKLRPPRPDRSWSID